MTFYGFDKKWPFFMAIKFEISLVITFMAFYDCVRTLYNTLLYFIYEKVLNHYSKSGCNVQVFPNVQRLFALTILKNLTGYIMEVYLNVYRQNSTKRINLYRKVSAFPIEPVPKS